MEYRIRLPRNLPAAGILPVCSAQKQTITMGNHSNVRENYFEVRENYFGVKENHLEVRENYSGVKENYSGVRKNHFEVRENYSGVKENHLEVRENHLEVRENYSEVGENYSGVRKNHSGVRKNHSGVSENYFGVSENHSEVNTNYSGASKRYKKNSATPPTVITAPAISFQLIFSLNKITEGAIIKTGVIDINVAAIPACVCCTASSENETPRNGPKNAPRVIRFIAGIFLTAALNRGHRFIKVRTNTKPITPVSTLICEAEKAS